jgi:uncharacterized protein
MMTIQRLSPTPTTPSPEPARPWWRYPMVWLVVSGPLAVVVASLVTAVVAWTHIDPVISGSAADDVQVPANPKDRMAPALKARNHAASPER